MLRSAREAAVGGVVDEVATAEAQAAHKVAGMNTEPPIVWKLAPCTSLLDFRDQDLRDTAVTWLELAGATKFEIASITAHSLRSIDEILKHHLSLHPELARSAIGKLTSWLENTKIN